MTIGERIYQIRKEKGLSQEELAKQLLVSRQTVSQWETDQTVPSIDNIYRLKDVLSVSFDELLAHTPGEDQSRELPLEEYRFSYVKRDIQAANRLVYKRVFLHFFFVLAASLASVISMLVSGESGFGAGIFGGIFLVTLIRACQEITTLKRAEQKVLAGTEKKQYLYRVYSDRLTVTVMTNEAVSSHYVIHPQETEGFWQDKEYYIWQYANRLFILQKSRLKSHSILPTFFVCPTPVPVAYKKPKRSGLSPLLIVLSVLSLLAALMTTALATEINHLDFVENMWVFYLFTPIPLASVAFGLWRKHRGERGVGYIVTGLVMVAFLCIYGSFFFRFSNVYTHDYQIVAGWEEQTGLALPDSGEITTRDHTGDTQSGPVYLNNRSTVVFDAKEATDFVQQIAGDERWMTQIPSQLQGCLPSAVTGQWDYCLLYHMGTQTFNTLPPGNGKYHFLFFKFTAETGTLTVEDYKKDIVADE